MSMTKLPDLTFAKRYPVSELGPNPLDRLAANIEVSTPRLLREGKVEQLDGGSVRVSFPDARFRVTVRGPDGTPQAALDALRIGAGFRQMDPRDVPFLFPEEAAVRGDPRELARRLRKDPNLAAALTTKVSGHVEAVLADQLARKVIDVAELLTWAAGERADDDLAEARHRAAAKPPKQDGDPVTISLEPDPALIDKGVALISRWVAASFPTVSAAGPAAAANATKGGAVWSETYQEWQTVRTADDGSLQPCTIAVANFWLLCVQNAVWGALKNGVRTPLPPEQTHPLTPGPAIPFPFNGPEDHLYFQIAGAASPDGQVLNRYELACTTCQLG